jgi:hypothetical protein
VKYLGLIIEKDEEYDGEDMVERKYVPIRDRYI